MAKLLGNLDVGDEEEVVRRWADVAASRHLQNRPDRAALLRHIAA
jgi:hypothetical protein